MVRGGAFIRAKPPATGKECSAAISSIVGHSGDHGPEQQLALLLATADQAQPVTVTVVFDQVLFRGDQLPESSPKVIEPLALTRPLPSAIRR
jgi:hypothetical protein